MLSYLNKEGKPISKDEWNLLIRDPKYVLIQFHCRGYCTFECSWLGLVDSTERKPGVFFVRVRFFDNRPPHSLPPKLAGQGMANQGSRQLKEEHWHWYTEEQEAIAAYRRLLAETTK